MNNKLSPSSEQMRVNINAAAITGTGNSVEKSSIKTASVIYDIHDSTIQLNKEHQATIEKEPIWFNVRDPVISFTGRDNELKDLHQALQNKSRQAVVSQITSISGLGGIGKSELARKYAYEYKQYYACNAIWMNAETQESLRKSVHELAEELSIKVTADREKQERNIKSIIKDLYKYFQNTKSLFIFDNAEEYEDIKEFLTSSLYLHPNDNKPHILITSRNRDWEVGEEGKITVLQIDALTPENAAEFIRKALELDKNKDDLQETQMKLLAERLQYFPLALRQAIAYIKEKNKILGCIKKKFEIIDYLKKYEEEAGKLLNFESKYGNDRYTKTTFVTWRVTIENIKQKKYGEIALNILNMLAYLAPDNVPIGEFFSRIVEDEEELSSAIDLLNQYSMINVVEGVSNIHRLVQQVIRIELQNQSKEEQILSEVLELMNNSNVEMNEDHVITIWGFASLYEKLIGRHHFDSKMNWIKYFNSNMGSIKYTVLHILAKNGHCKTIKAILTHIEKYHSYELCKIINTTDSYGNTPIHFAASEGELDVVKYFIEKGADLTVPNKHNNTPIHLAVRRGKLDVVKYLVDKGADFTIPHKYGKVTIYLAVRSGQLDVVKYLIEIGADFMVSDEDGYTPINFAAQMGKWGVTKYLIEIGADLTVPDGVGNTPIHFAAKWGNLDAVKHFIEKGADYTVPNKYGKTPIHLAAEGSKSHVVKYLIEIGADFTVPNQYGDTPIHLISKWGQMDIVEYLIEKGANFTVLDGDGNTPIHLAAQNGQLDVIKCLIEIVADFAIPNEDGNTPIHLAARWGKLDVVKYLIEKGAGFTVPNKYGNIPLHLAAKKGELNVVKYLIEKGADFTVPDGRGNTPIHLAAEEGKLDIVKYFVEEKRADFIVSNGDCYTPLHLAAKEGELDVVEYLIENGADFTVSDGDDNTPLHFAAKEGQLDVVEYLIENGADFTVSDGDGNTPLHFAAKGGQLDVVEYLIENGADFTVPDGQGNTPIHLSAKEGKLDVVKYLVEKGADFTVPDRGGNTPTHLAAEEDSIGCSRMPHKKRRKW